MKPKLTTSLKSIILGASTISMVNAGYNGGQLINQNDPAFGTPLYSGDILIEYTNDDSNYHGGIELTGENGKEKTLNLEGNIHIIAGEGLQESEEAQRNHGVLVAEDPASTEWSNQYPGFNSSVILKTSNADDQIKIDIHGNQSSGVAVWSVDSKIVLDAGSSSKDIEINLHNTDNGYYWARGLSAFHGEIDVIGNLKITTAGENAHGIYVSGESNNTGQVKITGNTTIVNAGNNSNGIRAQGGKTLMSGNLDITTVGASGIRTSEGALITVGGNTHITTTGSSSTGLRATDSEINFMGDVTMHSDGLGFVAGDGGIVTVSGKTHITNTGVSSGISSSGNIIFSNDLTLSDIGIHGIFAQKGGHVSAAKNVSINNTSIANDYSYSLYSDASTISIEGKATLKAVGEKSDAIRVNGEGGLVQVREVEIQADRHGFLISNSGKVNIIENLNIEITGNNESQATYGINAHTSGNIHVGGSTVIIADSHSKSHGIYSRLSTSIIFDGDLGMKVGGIGMQVESGSSVRANSTVDITSGSTSIMATGESSTVSLMAGAKNITNTAGGYAILADASGVINGQKGYYNIHGNIATSNLNSTIELSMSGRSVLNGSTSLIGDATVTGTQTINLSLTNASLWNVTADSSLTNLTLDGTSWLSFNLLDSESMTFANITATSIALEEGAVLQLLGVKSSDFETLGRVLTTFTANLLNAATLTSDEVKLVTDDNYALTYTNNGDGSFTITGVTGEQLFIPEPATATLGILGLASLILRRRRV